MLCIPELGTFFAILVPLYGNTKKKVSTFFENLEDIIGTHLDSGTKETYLKLYRAPLGTTATSQLFIFFGTICVLIDRKKTKYTLLLKKCQGSSLAMYEQVLDLIKVIQTI